MASVYELLTYGVEVNWRLMWFPIRSSAALKEVRARSASFRLLRSEVPPPDLGWVHTRGFDLGQGDGDGDQLGYPDQPVVAFITIGTGTSNLLEADLELRLGKADTRTTVTVEPGARAPFMLSIQAQAGEGDLVDTAAVVDGVFSAEGRLSFSGLATRH